MFRVMYWDDENDKEVFGANIEAEDESEAEAIFFGSYPEVVDLYDEIYPILTERIVS